MLKGTGTLASKSRLTALYGRAESSPSQPSKRPRKSRKGRKKDSSGFFLGKEVERREKKEKDPTNWNGLLLWMMFCSIRDRVSSSIKVEGAGEGKGKKVDRTG